MFSVHCLQQTAITNLNRSTTNYFTVMYEPAFLYFFIMSQQPGVDQGLFIIEDSW